MFLLWLSSETKWEERQQGAMEFPHLLVFHGKAFSLPGSGLLCFCQRLASFQVLLPIQLNIGCVSDPSHFLPGAVWDSGQAEGGRELLPLQAMHQPAPGPGSCEKS